MIGVTERAKAELKNILDAHVDYPLACLRLTTNERGTIGISIDVEMPDDTVIEYQGNKLLVINKEIADQLKNITIDIDGEDEGTQLVIIDNNDDKE
jgi:Fe-S cluster assembly iron-binding protein IscA